MINSNDIQERQNSEFALKVQYAARMCFNSAEKYNHLTWIACLVSAFSVFFPSGWPMYIINGIPGVADAMALVFGRITSQKVSQASMLRKYFDSYVLDRVTDGVTVAEDELLHAADSPVGGNAIRHQQLVAAFRFLQQPLQHHGNTVVLDGNNTHLTALALYGEGVFPQRTLRCGGVHAEELMDTQTGVACQIQGEDVVLPLLRHGAANQLAELRVRPCAILLSEAAAFQGDAQFFVVRQRVFWVGHLVVEKSDGGEVGFDGAGGLALRLQIENIAHQMLAAEVLQLL